MFLLSKLESFVFSTTKVRLFLILFIISILKCGIWYIPNFEGYLMVPQNPFANLFPDVESHYLMWSWLGPYMAWKIGAVTFSKFFAFHFVFSCLFSFIAYWSFYNERDERMGRMMAIAFTIMPAATTLFYWVSSDSITLFLMILILLTRRNIFLSAGLAVLLGMQHFEQGFCAFFAVLLAAISSRVLLNEWKIRLPWILAVCTGVILGKGTLLYIFHRHGVVVSSNRFDWMISHIDILLSQLLYSWQTTLWSVLGVAWLLVLCGVDKSKSWIPLLVGLSAILFLAPISGDQTRVLTIVAFPLYYLLVILNLDFMAKVSSRSMIAILAIWLLVPWTWVWGGDAKDSIIMQDLVYLLSHITHYVNLPAQANPLSLWPFQ